MSTIKELHRAAMEQTDLALAAQREGGDAKALFTAAFEFERQAAMLIAPKLDAEPTRSILHRSAATLALDCGHTREAEILICEALRGQPPEAIAEELRDLLEQVYFQRHLKLRGVSLGDTEIQMSISGNGIGLGIAPVNAFLPRIQDTARLIYRTAERLAQVQFRFSGQVQENILNKIELFSSIPRVASFAISLRIGHGQINFPGASSPGEEAIDEMLGCLDIFNKGKQEELKKRIPQKDYYTNFVALARNIGPDGQSVNQVGFSTLRQGELRTVALTGGGVGAADFAPVFGAAALATPAGQDRPTEIQGFLKEADSRGKKKGKIHVVDSQGVDHTVVVPPSMMTDIVKPLWEAEVVIVGKRKGGVLHLTDITVKK